MQKMTVELTPWYLRLLGYKRWRRKELVSVMIIYDTHKWVYYDNKPEALPLVRAWTK